MNEQIKDIASKFQVNGIITSIVEHGDGYINDTYAVTCECENGSSIRYILQRINHDIFRNPDQLMSNFRKVTDYLKKRLTEDGRDPERNTLTIVPARDGRDYVETDGNVYRMLLFIENTVSSTVVTNSEDFYRCAKAFGEFQWYLKDFPAQELYETIPNFHNTPVRYEAFVKAVKENRSNRLHLVEEEVSFINKRMADTYRLTELLKAGLLPLKVTHNDTKLSNILMDEESGESICVIDLDTIMPGLAAYDFGDSIRAGGCWSREDETDLDKVFLDLELFEAYTSGFIEGAKDGLSEMEIKTLPIGAKVITLEQGIRFLSDYLDGDLYYKTAYPQHNLDRARTQLKLVADMEKKWDEMNSIIEKYL